VERELARDPPGRPTVLFASVVVSFDEHGGTFGHVAPPDGLAGPTEGDIREQDFQFNRAGVRVAGIHGGLPKPA